MRNADYAPTDTPKSIRLIKCLKSDRFYCSSGVRYASNRSIASVLPTRVRAYRSLSIVRSSRPSGKSRTRRSASAKNSGIDHLARLLFAALQFLRGAKARILPPGTYDHSLLGAHHLDCDEGDLYDPATDLIKFIVSTACSNS